MMGEVAAEIAQGDRTKTDLGRKVRHRQRAFDFNRLLETMIAKGLIWKFSVNGQQVYCLNEKGWRFLRVMNEIRMLTDDVQS